MKKQWRMSCVNDMAGHLDGKEKCIQTYKALLTIPQIYENNDLGTSCRWEGEGKR